MIKEPVLWDKKFQDIYGESLERIKQNAPEYTALLPSDPGIAVLDAFLYQCQQLGEQMNLLPYASLVAWVNYIGIMKKGPVAASGTVRVELEEALPNDFIVPLGTRFLTEKAMSYDSTSEVIIRAGATSADVPVVCRQKGAIGNANAYEISHIYQRLPYVKSVFNPQPIVGGYDTELDNDTLDRGRKIINHLWRAVTPADYEEIVMTLPGIYKGTAIDTPGEIKLYLLSEDGQPANSELMRQAIEFLQPLKVQGVSLIVLPAVIKQVVVTARVKLSAGYQLLTVQSLVKARLRDAVNPKSWVWGRKVSISEVMAHLEAVQGIDYVEELILPIENIRLEPYELAAISEVTLYAV